MTSIKSFVFIQFIYIFNKPTLRIPPLILLLFFGLWCTPTTAQADTFIFSSTDMVFEADFNAYRGTGETLASHSDVSWDTDRTSEPFQGVNTGAFTAYTSDGIDHSFGIRERAPVDLRDARLFLKIENQTGREIIGFEVSYDVEAWFIGDRRNRIRLKYDIYPDSDSSDAAAGRNAFEVDILSTENPSSEFEPETAVDGKQAEHRTAIGHTHRGDVLELGHHRG